MTTAGTEKTDEALMGHIAAGEHEFVRALIERYDRPLIAFLRRLTGRFADADDLFQDVWLRVVKSARSYDPEQRFSAWLFTIVWNRVRDYWRRRAALGTRETDLRAVGVARDGPASPGAGADEEMPESPTAERQRRRATVAAFRRFEPVSGYRLSVLLRMPAGAATVPDGV